MGFLRRMTAPEPVRVLMKMGHTYEEAVMMMAPTDLYDINKRQSKIAKKASRDLAKNVLGDLDRK